MFLQTTNYRDFQVGESHFTGSKGANRCLPGDEVVWNGVSCHLVKRLSHRFIPGVLETNSKVLYGHTSHGGKMFLFHPHDRKYPPFRVGSKCRDLSRNQLGVVDFMDWDEVDHMPRGILLRHLGPCGDVKAEREALMYHYSSPKLAKELFAIDNPDHQGRIPLQGCTFNIDPDGCRDIDDVLTLTKISDTEWDFVITISDVAAHILEGSEGDVHAFALGETLYQNGDAVVPMLPPALSEMALSLRPNESHVGVSLVCRWNTQTNLLTVGDFQETVFTNTCSYTYETIYKAKDVPLPILNDIASFLHGSPTNDSHEWVAEAMLLYNKHVALKLVEHTVGLLRAHSPPDAERLTHFTAIHPDLQYLAYTAATYAPSAPGLIHAGLGSVPYCHASSPIRRYADLVNQRHLKAILKGAPLLPTPTSVAEHLNAVQKRMRAYERSLFFLEQVSLVPSGTVEGLVLSSTEEKTSLYIPAWTHVIRADPAAYTVGEKVSVEYYADLQKPHWDARMVFRVRTKASATAMLSE